MILNSTRLSSEDHRSKHINAYSPPPVIPVGQHAAVSYPYINTNARPASPTARIIAFMSSFSFHPFPLPLLPRSSSSPASSPFSLSGARSWPLDPPISTPGPADRCERGELPGRAHSAFMFAVRFQTGPRQQRVRSHAQRRRFRQSSRNSLIPAFCLLRADFNLKVNSRLFHAI